MSATDAVYPTSGEDKVIDEVRKAHGLDWWPPLHSGAIDGLEYWTQVIRSVDGELLLFICLTSISVLAREAAEELKATHFTGNIAQRRS
ncbi:hypothetical protein ACOSP7_014874 [Xanthoceras sorbifolium]